MNEGSEARPAKSPQRPGIPFLLHLALSFWAAGAAVYAGSYYLSSQVLTALITAGLCGCALMVLLLFRMGTRAWLVFLTGLLLGSTNAWSAALMFQGRNSELPECGATWSFELLEDPRPGDDTYKAFALASSSDLGIREYKVRLTWKGAGTYYFGDRLEAETRVKPFTEQDAIYAWENGLSGKAWLSDFRVEERRGLKGLLIGFREQAIAVLDAYGGKAALLMEALACGYRADLSQSDFYRYCKTAGLAHLVAVSGAHLALVTALLNLVLGAMKLKPRIRGALLGMLLSAYVVFCAMPLSALRAAIMVFTALLATFWKRRTASLNALALCIIAFPIKDVSCALSTSFALSAGATLGILLFSSLCESWFGNAPSLVRTWLIQPLGMTLAANLTTLPVSAALFSQVPALGLLSNCLAGPLFPVACFASLGGSLLAVAFPIAASVIIKAASLPVGLLMRLIDALASVPFTSVPIEVPLVAAVLLSSVLGFLLYRWWPKLRLGTLAFSIGAGYMVGIALLCLIPLLRGPELIMLNVGQGDAFILRSQGQTLLIDTGNREAMLKQALFRNALGKIDAVVISHADDDHCGLLRNLKGFVPVGKVILSAESYQCPCTSCTDLVADAEYLVGKDRVERVSLGDAFICGDFHLRVVWPRAFSDEGGNADSLCLLVSIPEACKKEAWSMLFTGDAERDEVAAMLSELGETPIDILKVGHHGSRKSLDAALAQQMQPKVALISVGEHNRYGHPSPEVLESLKAVQSMVLRSDQHGDAVLRFTGKSVSVKTQQPEAFLG